MDAEINPNPKPLSHRRVFSFVGRTGYFLIAGIFIPGLTAMVLLGLQLLLTELGVECTLALRIIFSTCAIGSLIAPYLFIRFFEKVDFTKTDMSTRLIFFNILEYIFIQGGLALLFDANTLCYVSDGQNGIQLVVTAWAAIPILILLSWLFDVLHKKHLRERGFDTAQL